MNYSLFFQLIFEGAIALFSVVNPIGNAFILNSYFENLDRQQRRRAVKKVTLNAFSICTVALLSGHWILQIFGISLPVVQLAGGIMICKMGWQFLASDDKPDGDAKTAVTNHYTDLENHLFYPISFPTTTGAGTISVLFTLGAHATKMSTNWMVLVLNMSAIFIAIIVLCVLIYIFYLNTNRLIGFLGSGGEKVIKRISAFLIFCVGLQIAVSGIMELLKK